MKSKSNILVASLPASTDGAIITGLEAGSGIDVSTSLVYSGMPAPDVYYSQSDVDALLKSAVMKHDADRSISIDYGTAYFYDDGSLFVECSLPCNNMLHMLVDEHDAVKSCDEALRVLEDMKNMISKMQEKAFELSLSQKAKDD